VIADVHHHPGGGPSLPGRVLEIFGDVGAIVALGDMGEAEGLDRLSRIAPVLGTLGGDDPKDDPRLVAGCRVFEACGLVIGATFDLSKAAGIDTSDGLTLPDTPLEELLRQAFGERVDVVLYGATHRAHVEPRDGVLFVNPGSPTLAEQRTVARVELGESGARAEIVPV
jgi:putative phosphoesterase